MIWIFLSVKKDICNILTHSKYMRHNMHKPYSSIVCKLHTHFSKKLQLHSIQSQKNKRTRREATITHMSHIDNYWAKSFSSPVTVILPVENILRVAFGDFIL